MSLLGWLGNSMRNGEEDEEEEDEYELGMSMDMIVWHSPPEPALHLTFKRLRKLRHPVHPIYRGSRPSSPPLTHRLRAQTSLSLLRRPDSLVHSKGTTLLTSPMKALVWMAGPVFIQWFSNWLIQIYNNICVSILMYILQ
ncbi:hypothetical protein GYMLUDRAFT_51283 [Collybiopsis luxurians FD-317 M1]|uniref:Uncharacterized protein n=1 Tax=Collybiopsis luxurians FD-317 M1 TaxID=944289 RepID=A0A0D0BY03_9AGAR|nr:hypothetical protein GYMLUDRAFT_51283 [Collybiopsis luxurians FD-317 M1]